MELGDQKKGALSNSICAFNPITNSASYNSFHSILSEYFTPTSLHAFHTKLLPFSAIPSHSNSNSILSIAVQSIVIISFHCHLSSLISSHCVPIHSILLHYSTVFLTIAICSNNLAVLCTMRDLERGTVLIFARFFGRQKQPLQNNITIMQPNLPSQTS